MAGKDRRNQSEETTGSKHRHRTLWIVLSSVVVFLLVVGGGGYYWLTKPLTHNMKYPTFPTATANQTTNTSNTNSMNSVNSTPSPPNPSRLNVLLIGTDTRPGEIGGNTDVLILASIDPANQRIELLSIPRDTKIMYPDGSYRKINSGLDLGGPALTESLVTQLTGEPIDNYALTHFGGLIDIINTIGGVTVNVKERMYYNTGDKEYNIINLKPGVQTLNGVDALGFVRFRHDALGDIGRTERQQEFLKALSNQLLQPQNIVKLPTLVREFWGTIDSDMSLLNVLHLASNANTYKNYQVISETLPGSFHDPDPTIKNDQSYWIVNPAEAKYMSNQFFEDGLVQSNPIQDPNVTANWTQPAPSQTNSTGNATDSASGNASSSSTNTTNNAVAGQSGTSSNTALSVTTPSGATPQNLTVAANSAYIRSGPATSYPIIASAVNGQSVSVIGVSGQWDEVIVGSGKTGYIAGWLLSPAPAMTQ